MREEKILIENIEKKRGYIEFQVNNKKYKILKKIAVQYELPLEMPIDPSITKIEFDKELFFIIYEDSRITEGKEKAIKNIIQRRKTEKEIKFFLKKHNFEPEIIEKIIMELKKLDYINDISYTHDYVEYQKNEKLLSRFEIEHKLKLKLEDDNLIHTAIDSVYPVEDEIGIAIALLKKKKFKLTNSKEDLIKIKKFLLNKGFNYLTITKVIELISTKNNTNNN